MSEHLEHDVVSWSGRSVEGYTDMAIVIELDEIMEDRGVSLNKLSHRVGITNVNLSRIKTGKVRAVRFSTLAAIRARAIMQDNRCPAHPGSIG